MAEFDAEVYERDIPAGSYGYRIRQNGSVIINQDYLPGAEGFQPMTQEQAWERASQEVVMLEKGDQNGIRS